MGYPYDAAWLRVRKVVLVRDGYACQLRLPRCKGRATEVDHIVPLMAGGPRLDPHNLRAACKPCNVAARNNFVNGRNPEPRSEYW